MGSVRDWANRLLLTHAPTRKNFDSAPKPIDVMFADMYRTTGTSVGRLEALSVPAVQRGRNMLCSIATLPLVQLNQRNEVQDNPLFRQIDPDVPNVVTLAQTIEDLVMEATSYWLVTARDFDGFPMTARHLDHASVTFRRTATGLPAPLPSGEDPRGAVPYVDGVASSWSELIRFDSPNPGVLKHDGRVVRRAIALDKAAAMYADDPRPLDYFTPGEGAEPLTEPEELSFLAKWKAARKARATAFIPTSVKYNSVDSPSPQELQLVELQRQVWLELANAFGLDPEDLGVSTTSRTYTNAIDRRRDRINDVYAPYMRAITDRLSMGDVTRRGHRVQFDLNDYLKSNPTEQASVDKAYLDMGVIGVEEIRAARGLPPGAPQKAPAPSVDNAAQAHANARVTFSGTVVHFDADLRTEFAVDTEARTITGILMPYNAYGSKYGMKFRFSKGALKWSDPKRVKLLRDHDPASAVGYAKTLKDTPQGLIATFKVANGPAGDEALQLALDGVLDGLSAGTEFDTATDVVPDPKDRSAWLVTNAALREGSLTALPAFDDARLTQVNASLMEGTNMEECSTCGQRHAPGVACTAPQPVPAPIPVTFTADQVQAMLASLQQPAPAPAPAAQPEGPTVVDPSRSTAVTFVREALPYRFQRRGVFASFQQGDHVFSADLHEMGLANDNYGTGTDAGKRVMGLLNAAFTRHDFVVTTDIDELNPAIQRPDLFVDQQDYRYPIYSSIDRGAPPNGVNPFTFPKFSSSSNLVADHVEGTEPGAGTYVTTSQTITPTPVSGKVRLTREVWDMGGNPAVSTLIFNQMVRGYREGLESAAATFLNTLTAATDINLGVAVSDAAFTAAWEAAVAGLQFARGYDFSTFVVDQSTYLKAVGARDTTGKPYYPQITPTNANGQSEPRFARVNMAGVLALPSWALPSTPGSPNNSWLYDTAVVWGFSTPPQRLEFPGSGAANIYTPVAGIDLAIWGYKAFANTDIAGVRQVIYDTV